MGYSAYYVGRSNLAVAAPLLVREFGARGLNEEVRGQIASVGVPCYAAGKVLSGVLGDLLGAKRFSCWARRGPWRPRRHLGWGRA